jgi:hypothetical protein
MTLKYGLQFFFFEMTENGQNFLAAIVLLNKQQNKKHFVDVRVTWC